MAEKRKPLIDDSEPQKEHSLEDDFNDLIRRELGGPEPKKEIVIEPVAPKPVRPEPAVIIEPVKPVVKPEVKKVDVPKVEKKVEVKKVETPKVEVKKVEVKPAPKVEAKPVPKVVPVKVAPKPEPKVVAKPEPKVVAKTAPKTFTPKPVPKAVSKPAPKKVEPRKVSTPVKAAPKAEKVEPKVEHHVAHHQKDSEFKWGRWVALAILLLVAMLAVFAVGAFKNSKDSAAIDCAVAYADGKGESLSWSDSSAVEQYWLRKAFEAHSEVEASEIAHMLACDEAFLSTLSDPAGYANCKTPQVYVVVDDRTLGDNPAARLDSESILGKFNAEATMKKFTLAYKLTEPSVRAWKVVE